MKNINMIRLIADSGKILINGDLQAYAVDVPEDKQNDWIEIDEEELIKNKE